MTKKIFSAVVLILVIVLSSACSSLPTAVAATSTTAEATQTALTNNLGIGLIKLEGSALQVTAEQADDLLLLWKGVKLLTTDKTASSLELTALFEQIQGSLTTEQIEAIRQVTWTQDEVNQAIQTYAGQNTAAAAAKKTTTSSSSSSGMSGGPGGGPGGDMAAITGASAASSTSSNTTSAQAKAIAASKSGNTASAGLNARLADAIIALLKQRVNG
jgi:hypothetical protein